MSEPDIRHDNPGDESVERHERVTGNFSCFSGRIWK
jgi:hypothetical protein